MYQIPKQKKGEHYWMHMRSFLGISSIAGRIGFIRGLNIQPAPTKKYSSAAGKEKRTESGSTIISLL